MFRARWIGRRTENLGIALKSNAKDSRMIEQDPSFLHLGIALGLVLLSGYPGC
jgi:hypothetical protein